MIEHRLSSYAANSSMSPHTHESCSFTVVLKGTYQENIRNRAQDHRPGSMLFYPAGETHSQNFGKSGSSKLIFTPPASALEFLSEQGVPLACAPSVRMPAISQLARRVVAEIRHGDRFSELALNGLLLELVALFGHFDDTGRHGKVAPPWLKQVREILEDEPAQATTNEALAAQVGKHPVHLAKVFRRHFGETLGEYQRRLRLQKAEKLLRSTKMNLVEVALECGFAHHAHLSRSFKNAYGISPSHFRRERP